MFSNDKFAKNSVFHQNFKNKQIINSVFSSSLPVKISHATANHFQRLSDDFSSGRGFLLECLQSKAHIRQQNLRIQACEDESSQRQRERKRIKRSAYISIDQRPLHNRLQRGFL